MKGGQLVLIEDNMPLFHDQLVQLSAKMPPFQTKFPPSINKPSIGCKRDFCQFCQFVSGVDAHFKLAVAPLNRSAGMELG